MVLGRAAAASSAAGGDMAAADIRAVNPSNLHNIESFFNDAAYREAIENSANFNTRLCLERRLRMPFLDPQTGVAQNHCSLFMSRHQRMPGAREGQIYTYPAARWRKARRQYLSYHRGGRWGGNNWSSSGLGPGGSDGTDGPGIEVTGDGTSMDAHDTDSKDSHQRDAQMKDDVPKEWFYDDMGMEELDTYDEPEPESDEDYCDENYSSRRKRGGGGGGRSGGAGGIGGTKGKRSSRGGGNDTSRGGGGTDSNDSPAPKRGRGGGGRGRKKAPQATLPYEVAGDADKPYGCELCGARYKTRPGLTYHYSHSHKETAGGSAGSDGDSRDSPARPPVLPGATPPADPAAPTLGLPNEYQDSYVTFLNNPAGPPRRLRPPGAIPSGVTDDNSVSGNPSSPAPSTPPPRADDDTSRSSEPPPSPSASRSAGGSVKPPPSPYCDFCLGDQRENKKTGAPEELVSCSDCGRSGKSKLSQKHEAEYKSIQNNIQTQINYSISNNSHLKNGHDITEISLNNRCYPEDEFDTFAKNTRLLEDNADKRSRSGRNSRDDDEFSLDAYVKSPPPQPSKTIESEAPLIESPQKNSTNRVPAKRGRKKKNYSL